MKIKKLSKLFLEAIVNNSFVGTTIIDKDGYIIFRNKISEEISGIKNDDVLGKHFSVIPGKGELLEVLKTGIPKFGVLYKTIKSTNAVIHRFPLYDNHHEILGAMTIVTFKDAMEMEEILEKYNIVKGKLESYQQELRNLRSAKYSLDSIIGESDKILYTKKLIINCARVNSPVLITGDTGTGKELCAHAIHMASERRNGPFVKINCASIPHDLFESELFGYEPGAFTSAKTQKLGKFELANHGTIFLDEISCLPFEMQSKLLRVLQDNEIERIGGNKVIKINFRLITATNKDLGLLVRVNNFREDLYYRIGVFNLNIPSLRERKEDMLPLCDHFIKSFNEEFGLRILGIDEEVMNIFDNWHWPGNVRELKNVIERAVNFADSGMIRVENLPDYLSDNPKLKNPISENNLSINLLKEAKNGLERRLLESTLIELNWNKSKSARQIGISRPLLYALIKKYGLKG